MIELFKKKKSMKFVIVILNVIEFILKIQVFEIKHECSRPEINNNKLFFNIVFHYFRHQVLFLKLYEDNILLPII